LNKAKYPTSEANSEIVNVLPLEVVDVVSGTGVVDVVSGTGVVDVVSGTGVVDVVSGTGVVDVVSGTEVVGGSKFSSTQST
jgi:hypothetical protein